MTIVIFIIVLAVLIFVHEFGHFLAAWACGIRIDAFAIGFGPKLFSWKFPVKKGSPTSNTEYSIRAIPFGGYVKIFGENPDEENTHGPDSHRSFVHKPRWQQAIVLAAGIVFNLLFACLLYISVFYIGVAATPDGFEKYSNHFSNPRIMVTDVPEKTPAYNAGIKVGDVIGGIDLAGQISSTAPVSIDQIQSAIQNSNGKSITIVDVRKGVSKNIEITPVLGMAGMPADKFAIGIAMDNVVDIKLPFWSSIMEGFHYTYEMIKNTIVGLVMFIITVFRGTADFSSVSGPIGIAGIVGDAAGLGFTFLLMVTALISINLGIINLIPFPALDGGRILFVAIEAVIRRRISPTLTNTVNTVGFALLIALMILVTYKDILKLVK